MTTNKQRMSFPITQKFDETYWFDWTDLEWEIAIPFGNFKNM